MSTHSNDLNKLACATFLEHVKNGAHYTPVEVVGHKSAYSQNFSDLQAESHEAARDLLQTYEIEDSMIASSVELVDVLAVRQRPEKSKPDPKLLENYLVQVTGLQPAPEMINLLRPDGRYFAGRLNGSKRLLWTAEAKFALPIDIEQRRFWQEELKTLGFETLVTWSYGQ